MYKVLRVDKVSKVQQEQLAAKELKGPKEDKVSKD